MRITQLWPPSLGTRGADRGFDVFPCLPAPIRTRRPTGNCYCVLIQIDTTDPYPVHFWEHDIPGTLEEMKIADSLDEFIARPRVSDSDAEDGVQSTEGEE